eukprot:Awhi_evm1s1740
MPFCSRDGANSEINDGVITTTFKSGRFGSKNGSQFYTDEGDRFGREALLEYQLRFKSGFDFQLGGKLPGMHGGSSKTCSGGRAATGSNCWSARLMWRTDGVAETYFYVPMGKTGLNEQDRSFCSKCHGDSRCSANSAHCSFGRGDYTFTTDEWYTVKQYVKVNTDRMKNGEYTLHINDTLIHSHEKIKYSTSNLHPRGLLFSTFYGGSTRAYAPDNEGQIEFRDFKFYA